jgi:hypothetical protein
MRLRILGLVLALHFDHESLYLSWAATGTPDCCLPHDARVGIDARPIDTGNYYAGEEDEGNCSDMWR